MTLHIICALAANGAIGHRGGLLYHLPADLRRFKNLTSGHTIIMGRKTFESLPKGALPNRRNVVISRQPDYSAPGAEVYSSWDEALRACQADDEVYAIGGESVYAAALPVADRLCLTHIEATPAEADTFFPPYDRAAWRVAHEERHEADERNGVGYAFVDYERA